MATAKFRHWIWSAARGRRTKRGTLIEVKSAIETSGYSSSSAEPDGALPDPAAYDPIAHRADTKISHVKANP
ncbi:hypothetical protein [Rhodopseudomonas sp. P2A-2r]|uniref:hypothetical protein n=1 Tax=unclassified Rhodopseudomonas TaxID=2638247 RepID=UPI0022340184|nr:hypothetical protein [Rhodopseudomonas sp. P2A-2r]UZE48375.1 hypothetical protein ONR75_26805 [Rhodopseudomonas sp. P2A-2r]